MVAKVCRWTRPGKGQLWFNQPILAVHQLLQGGAVCAYANERFTLYGILAQRTPMNRRRPKTIYAQV